MSSIEDVETELGPARLYVSAASDPKAVLVLGHGAGGGVDAPDLAALTALAGDSITVVRFEQPWRTAGKKVAPAPARLDVGWVAAMARVAERCPGLPLFVGGRSAGARVACRYAAEHEVAGVVALSFPLHPPGRPEKSRADELLGVRCPTLILQGGKDPFGKPAEVAEAIAGEDRYRLVEVPDCAHELKPPARSPETPESIAGLITAEVRAFTAGIPGGADAL